jgi:signal transduction histidine kinase
MALRRYLSQLGSRRHLPRPSVRLRLTLLYGGLFLVSGGVLLAISNVLVRRATGGPVFTRTTRSGQGPNGLPTPEQLQAQAEQLKDAADRQHAAELDQLLLQSGIALAIMAFVSIGLGWLVAGRVLRPLREITTSTRRISQHNLHERLALQGPSDELKDLADTIDGLLARLEAAFNAQRRFVANASHELRTPLAMMRTSLDVATGKPGPLPPQLDALDAKLREGLEQADRLLESFLTLAHAQNGALTERTTVSLGELLSAAIEARADAVAEQRLTVEQRLGDINVAGSETLLARLVENVVDNAVRHNERSGWIRAETRSDGETARLVVENGGSRLEQRSVQELGQPFRRLAADRTDSQNGVGLGLSIVAAIAAAHGGNLQLHARAEGGLRVQIELPRVSARAVAGEPA